jgi:type IV pilus assembly protein PilV
MAKQSGFVMIEVLVTIALVLVGLLGLAGLQSRVSTAEFESYQRAQAIVIIQDIVDRMNANKRNIASYVQNNIGASGTLQTCSGSGATFDLCQINNELIGASESSGSTKLGAMIGARACITAAGSNKYIVTVAWQGMIPSGTATAPVACGAGLYGTNDALRRTLSMPVRLACLSCP